MFGGDGSNDPVPVQGGRLVRLELRAAHRPASPPTQSIIAGWKKANPGKSVGSFGPPTYGAVQILLDAIKKACAAGKGSIQARRGHPRT